VFWKLLQLAIEPAAYPAARKKKVSRCVLSFPVDSARMFY